MDVCECSEYVLSPLISSALLSLQVRETFTCSLKEGGGSHVQISSFFSYHLILISIRDATFLTMFEDFYILVI